MKKSGFTTAVILIVAVLTLLIGAYLYWQRGKATPLTPAPTPATIPSSTPKLTPLPTHGVTVFPAEINPGWQKIKSEKYGYSIEFPGDWKLNTSDPENVNFYSPDIRYGGAGLVEGIHFWVGISKLSKPVTSVSQLATDLSNQFEQDLEASLLEGPAVVRSETPFAVEYSWQGFGRPEALNRMIVGGTLEFSLSCVYGLDYRKEAKATCGRIFETFQAKV